MGILIGLTGGIGSGKSTVAAILADHGAIVIDADRIAHDIYLPGKEAFDLILERFGHDLLADDGTIDRAKLGGIVFGDRKALDDLNAVIHPLVRADVAARVAEAMSEDEHAVIVVEAALMTETGWTGGAGVLWVVITEPEVAAERLMVHRGMEPDEIRLRMAAQVDNATRRKIAGLIVENNGSIEDLENVVRGAWADLATDAGHPVGGS